MNVTFLLAGMDTYGGDRVIARYAVGLLASGWKVDVLTVAPPRNASFYGNLPIRDLGMEVFPTGRAQYARAARRLLRQPGGWGTLVATWTPTLPLALAARALGKADRVLWLQQDYPEMFDGLPFESTVLARGAALVDCTVAVSTACAQHAGGPSARIRVLHSGLEEGFFAPPGTPLLRPPATPANILFVGDPIERKGWPELVRALGQLREWGVDHRLTLVLRRPPAVDLPPGTRVALGLDDDRLADEYRAADVVVCASRQEGWGLPALEAMAAGTPVVSTLHSGCRAYARPGKNLVGVPVGSADALAMGIRDVLTLPALRATLVSEGRRTAAGFAWPPVVDLFALLAGGGHPPPFPWELRS